jgi:O6-methylguanine-DNA--protein-cysteine methyltransferase
MLLARPARTHKQVSAGSAIPRFESKGRSAAFGIRRYLFQELLNECEQSLMREQSRDAGISGEADPRWQAVEAPAIGLDLSLDLRGRAFRQRVWRALREIPAGERASYAEIAERIAAPRSARGLRSQ